MDMRSSNVPDFNARWYCSLHALSSFALLSIISLNFSNLSIVIVFYGLFITFIFYRILETLRPRSIRAT